MKKEKVPQLRFTEFETEWQLLKLKSFCSFFSGGTPSSGNKKFYTGDIPFIGSGNIFDSEVESFITKEALDNSSAKLVNQGDLLYALYGANSGSVSLSKITGAINQAILCIRSSSVDIRFLYFLLFHNRKRIVATYLQGGQGNLSAQIIKGLQYHFPSNSEQQKIANFLTSVDQKIQQLRRKKELLEEYKKGVMQKLFSQKIRFKDENGEDFPDWEEYNVDKVLKLFVTNSFSRNDLTYESGKVKNIHYGDIHSEFKMGFKVAEETVPYIAEENKLSKYNQEQYLKPGDLIIADASEDYVDIGKAIEVLETGDEKILAGLHTIHARDRKPLTVVGFKGYLFGSEAVNKQLKKISQGASVLGISKGNFIKIDIKLPCLAEQQKIVEFLQNIDENITLIESKIEKFQTFKKGLLQQMFV